ncbi:phosphotransferase [Brasilonema sp. UFV-L1]|uniref:phosphotransferase n=1 Tax=Brasilonema sp. UFV-L1 TaxID=2234130 RepID=UPI00145DF669|nr:phosphotransferase [Brasilonema sp. UFV-L1]NMG08707.1 aminoglycoside phosphotransferase family protein [Brasilonema sp. UFV-L1]
MAFVLSSLNVFEYLIKQGLCSSEAEAQSKIERKHAKNFNLLLNLPEGRQLLVKQEPRAKDGETAGEFLREWRIHEFFKEFPELNEIRDSISAALYFDAQESIIVFNYLNDYRDLIDFYAKENIFPPAIATALGTILAKIHRLTFERKDYQEFFSGKQEEVTDVAHFLVKRLERIGPEMFGLVPADGIKFFALYQRYDSLGQAIAELASSLNSCCLTHNDLKLNNILLSTHWEQAEFQESSSDNSKLRIIDWERCSWGDPAFDLGFLIGSYLHIWLGSLMAGKAMSIDESLRLAITPLEQLQPSLSALVIAYLTHFEEILDRRPDFLRRVVQFSGWSLISIIQATLQYQKSFGNRGICMLQVAKSLLCRPEQSIPTIFGKQASELTPTSFSPLA